MRTPSKTRPHFHAIVPAAGVGSRLGASQAKQYLHIGERSILQWVVDTLLLAQWIERILVVVAPADRTAARQLSGNQRVTIAHCGGASRRESVSNGLRHLGDASPHDWVLVHDAARPGLTLELLEALRQSVNEPADAADAADMEGAADAASSAAPASGPVGSLLAVPVADTVKRADLNDPDRSAATVPRERLWLAQTPQIFRLQMLSQALQSHPDATDEASAIEAMGYRPKLVLGSRRNFKVTTREDLALMRCLLLPQVGGAGTTAALSGERDDAKDKHGQ